MRLSPQFSSLLPYHNVPGSLLAPLSALLSQFRRESPVLPPTCPTPPLIPLLFKSTEFEWAPNGPQTTKYISYDFTQLQFNALPTLPACQCSANASTSYLFCVLPWPASPVVPEAALRYTVSREDTPHTSPHLISWNREIMKSIKWSAIKASAKRRIYGRIASICDILWPAQENRLKSATLF